MIKLCYEGDHGNGDKYNGFFRGNIISKIPPNSSSYCDNVSGIPYDQVIVVIMLQPSNKAV